MRYIQPRWKLVQIGICFDILNGQLRVLIVKPQSDNEVSYYPAMSFAVMVKIHKAISD